MWPHADLALLAFLPGLVCALSTACTPQDTASIRCTIARLGPLLSPQASISFNGSSDPRWSEFHAPTPGAVVNVATEQDVANTVSPHSVPLWQIVPKPNVR